MTTSLFISDLHLDPSRPDGMRLFDQFIRQKASAADQLFILGDLFEYWLGDDASEHCGYQSITDSLASLAASQTKVFFMHGNRDFLIGRAFASSIGGQLIEDPTKLKLGTEEVLLMHGDSLCTDDIAHQQFRAQTREKKWKDAILSQTIAEREEIARRFRSNSIQGNNEKSEAIMDVSQNTVESVMKSSDIRLLIHGHTHRPAIHKFNLSGAAAHRIVLGDWYKNGNYLRHDSNGFSLLSYPNEVTLASLKVA